jgi:hypothetical protein
MSEERCVAEGIGLDTSLVLHQACADFYVLETLCSQMTERHFWDGNGRQVGPRFPVDFGSDSLRERLGYEVHNTFEDREKRLAREFAVYLTIACGGELRHLRRIEYEQNHAKKKPIHCTHKRHKKACCNHDCSAELFSEIHAQCFSAADSLGEYALLWGMKEPCGCACIHNHSKTTCKMNLSGCGTKYKKAGLEGYTKYPCCSHSHEKNCYGIKAPWPTPDLVTRYLETLGADVVSRPGRSRGWETWWSLSREDPAPWMLECAESFSVREVWGKGPKWNYGGDTWASAANLCADYWAGNITPSTFVDRCWSLQHNGGSIFNKIYSQPVMTTGKEALMHVLEVQATGDYDSLVDFCTEYVQELWSKFKLATGQSPWRKKRRDLSMRVRDCQYCDNEGCDTCYPDEDSYHYQPEDEDEDHYDDHEGCACCYWMCSEHGECDPCGGSDINTPTLGCFYYNKWKETSQ